MIFLKSKFHIFIFIFTIFISIISGWFFSEFFINQKTDETNYINANFSLIDHHGNEVSQLDYKNFNKVFFFGFTHCPDVCPMGISILSNVIDELDDPSINKFLFVSVDPERDTPKRMNEYLSNFNNEIIGLTGDYKTLKPVWENFFVHVKSNMTQDQEPYSNLDGIKKYNSHDNHNSDNHSHSEASENNYIVQHSAFYFIFDRKDNLKTILPFGSSAEEIITELSNL